MNRLAHFIATGFYSGYFPWAPGTAGSAAAAALAFVLWRCFPALQGAAPSLILAAVVAAAGTAAANRMCDTAYFGEGNKDPKEIVVDEFAGYFVTIIGLDGSPLSLALGFAAFRFFDILKPPPVRQLERLPRGYGIVSDDLFAGIYALIVVRLILRLL